MKPLTFPFVGVKICVLMWSRYLNEVDTWHVPQKRDSIPPPLSTESKKDA